MAAPPAAEKKAAAPAAKPKATAAAPVVRQKKGVDIPKDFRPHDPREHLNIVFIGHVDAGKSTMSGQILIKTGQVSQRDIDKYTRDAKDKGRDSWYLAYILDTNEEERAKGKTVEVGRATFETKSKRFTLLDAPGHKSFVPNMIAGAAQADVGVLIISARKSEFEAGFDRGGQTREHAMLAKTLGVQRLIVAVNKMDEQTVLWNKKRYDQIVKKLTPFIKKTVRFKPKDVTFLPVSAYTGANLDQKVPKSVCDWYDGPTLFEILDKIKVGSKRDPKGPLRIPVNTKFRDMGAICVMGKVESGTIFVGQKLVVMPLGQKCECVGIKVREMNRNGEGGGLESVDMACPGENVTILVKGIEEQNLLGGFVICDAGRPTRKTLSFEATISVTELLAHKPLITAGYTCMLHCHTISVPCQISKLRALADKKSKAAAAEGKRARKPKFLKKGAVADVKIKVAQTVAVETYKDFSQLGRFTLRDEGKTIAIGKITKIKAPGKSKN